MIMTVLRQQPRAAGLVLGLIAANLLAWCWALQAFGDSGALMAASLLAWGYGLRHAVDADHIAAIDNVTRKMMQQGRRPFAVGAWFSLGHSSIVVLASAAIAATATAFSTQMSWLHDTGSVIGTAVSALFLLAMAFINLVILRSVWRSFRAWKRGEKGERRNRQRRRGDELAVWQDLPSDKPQLADVPGRVPVWPRF
ncbi:HoxN/HupN/NixA family nickel/cobalt transporter [Klebsiella pneumoniae subsp. pneumoniae]|nr:HoxN/HupN/NixA family nickel/cobalt transporter [Klebsiella pneumoniae subsp. pneumoniae]